MASDGQAFARVRMPTCLEDGIDDQCGSGPGQESGENQHPGHRRLIVAGSFGVLAVGLGVVAGSAGWGLPMMAFIEDSHDIHMGVC